MLVSPFRNHSSSWMIERRCSFFVVTSGKPSLQIEAHLMAEDGERAGSGPVVLADALVQDAAEQIVIGLHAVAPRLPYSTQGTARRVPKSLSSAEWRTTDLSKSARATYIEPAGRETGYGDKRLSE